MCTCMFVCVNNVNLFPIYIIEVYIYIAYLVRHANWLR